MDQQTQPEIVVAFDFHNSLGSQEEQAAATHGLLTAARSYFNCGSRRHASNRRCIGRIYAMGLGRRGVRQVTIWKTPHPDARAALAARQESRRRGRESVTSLRSCAVQRSQERRQQPGHAIPQSHRQGALVDFVQRDASRLTAAGVEQAGEIRGQFGVVTLDIELEIQP